MPVQVQGEVLSVRRMGAYHAMTVVAPGMAELTRPGHFVAVQVVWLARVRPDAGEDGPGRGDRGVQRRRQLVEVPLLHPMSESEAPG